nr:hypothetical protein [Halobellus salinus]
MLKVRFLYEVAGAYRIEDHAFQAGLKAARLFCVLLLFPQSFDPFFDVIEGKAADVTMVLRPLCVFCVGATCVRRRMEVVSFVVTAGVAVPATLPYALLALFLIVNGEVVVAIPSNLEPSRHITRVVITGEFDTEIELPPFDEVHCFEHPTASESGLYPL